MLTNFVVDCVSAGRVLCKAAATAIACALVRECIGRKEFRKEGRRRERRDEEGRNRWMTVRTGDSAPATKAVPRNQTRPSTNNNRKEGTFKPLPTFYKTVASVLCMSWHC